VINALSLDALGPRICIMGPSNSGKSTLADAISRKTALPAVRATGLILLDVKVPVALLRYIRRCYSSTPRIGGLGKRKEHMTLEMLKYIILTAPNNRQRHKKLYDQVTLPKILLQSSGDVKACLEYWGLELKNQ